MNTGMSMLLPCKCGFGRVWTITMDGFVGLQECDLCHLHGDSGGQWGAILIVLQIPILVSTSEPWNKQGCAQHSDGISN